MKRFGFCHRRYICPQMMDLVAQVQMVCGDQNGTADISSDGPGSVLLEGIRFRLIITFLMMSWAGV